LKLGRPAVLLIHITQLTPAVKSTYYLASTKNTRPSYEQEHTATRK
jgi:hypothetical protein